jgi:UDP-N-acetylglucosamine--N-acetylmuramyl-(pentapeptide) pyrophosphoryl-undecaprenol N-acetylglucosamine transferase
MTNKPRAYLFVGGGTGGHLYPALAIAEQIQSSDPTALVRFVCSNRPIDAQILSAAGVEFTPVDAMPLSKSGSGFMKFLKGWKSTATKARALIYELLPTHEVVIVAMGGFVAPSAACAARRIRVPIVLVNLDAVPGKANLLIARFADHVSTSLPVKSKRWEVLGPIVRSGATAKPGSGHDIFGLDPSKRTLLITGGSQGASSINGFVRAMVGNHPQAFEGWQIIHQLGPDDGADLAEIYKRADINAWVNPYIDRMDAAWGCADLTIGRCGAGTVAEAWTARVPGVFLPYPHHKDQHQKHNAKVLLDCGAAVILDDQIDPKANIAQHAQQLLSILTDPKSVDTMRAGYESLADANGAKTAAAMLIAFEH